MLRRFVESLDVASVGYDPTDQVLEIEFQSGSVYRYFDVPRRVYREIVSVQSPCRYHQTKIKKKYQRKRVSD